MNSILRAFPLTAAAGRNAIKSVVMSIFAMPERGLDLLHVWEGRLKQRHALATLDYRLLEDMGISPEAARLESAKPFWRA